MSDTPTGARSVDELRREVEAAGQRPVAERLAAFGAINEVLVDELAQLDEL